VPPDREDKRTADEDLSFGDQNAEDGGGNYRGTDIFNTSLQNDIGFNSGEAQQPQRKKAASPIDFEEEKEGDHLFSNGNQAAMSANINEML